MKKFSIGFIFLFGFSLNIFSQYNVEGKPALGSITSKIILNKIYNPRPAAFELYQNYPNPFSPNTRIKFDIPGQSYVNITVYDLEGKVIKNLVSKKLKTGTYSLEWFANDVPAGIYVYEMKSGDIKISRKMILAK